MSAWDQLAAFWGTGWDVHPERVLFFALMVGAYAAGFVRLGGGQRQGGRYVAWFGLGMTLLVLAVQSPLHHLADRYLFSAHMVQHQILTLIVPPLLLLGVPPWMATPVLDRAWIVRFGRSQYYPVFAFAAFNLFFALVHFPSVYDALFRDELLHFVTHGALLVSGLLTWLPLFSPAPDVLRRLPLPGQMIYCLAQSIPGSLVGSLIALSERLVYRHYGTEPLTLGVDPLSDQQLGGLFMWVGTGTFFLVLLTVLFFIWAEREERHAFG